MDNLSALLLHPLQIAFFGAIFGAVFGAFFSYLSHALQWRRQRKVETLNAVAKEFLALLDNLDAAVKNYWSASRAELGESREILLASTIRTNISHIQKCLRLFFALKSYGWAAQSEMQKQLQLLVDGANIHATGGLFDAKGRNASPETIMQTGDAILDLRIQFQSFIYQ